MCVFYYSAIRALLAMGGYLHFLIWTWNIIARFAAGVEKTVHIINQGTAIIQLVPC
jgi:hypothetical protein